MLIRKFIESKFEVSSGNPGSTDAGEATPPSSHTTGRTVPYPAVQQSSVGLYEPLPAVIAAPVDQRTSKAHSCETLPNSTSCHARSQ